MRPVSWFWHRLGLALAFLVAPLAVRSQALPGTEPLTWEGDLGARVVTSLDQYLDTRLATVVADRARRWQRDPASPEAFSRSLEPERRRLREILGVVDERGPVALRFTAPVSPDGSAGHLALGRGQNHKVLSVAWNVVRGVEGEGLLMVPDGQPVADVVLVPDCGISPESWAGLAPGGSPDEAVAARLAEAGCRVIVPVLLDRGMQNGGNPGYRHVEHSQRETLWRASYVMGRTPLGYDVQKVLAAADWLLATREPAAAGRPLGVAGHGEGGRVALHAAALDPRFQAALVSGYFQPQEQQWRQPIDRNAWSYVRDFGDAEIASLIVPRALVIESGRNPEATFTDAKGAAPGELRPPSPASVAGEVERARRLVPADWAGRLTLTSAEAGTVLGAAARKAWLQALGVVEKGLKPEPVERLSTLPDGPERQLRQFRQLLEDTQVLMRESPEARRRFWSGVKFGNLADFTNSTAALKAHFRREVIGEIPAASVPPEPLSRLLYETNGIRGYEVVLAVHEGLPAYGILVLPAGMQPGERRPVVVCQHGLEGRPRDVADPRVENPAYHRYAFRLAEQGFITFSPQNAYLGETRFRQVLRKAQPLGLTLWSFIVRQHEVITDWLAAQPYVDPNRIAFYGLSYGGKSAMRIPVWVDRYCLSICSADYNEWIWKNVSARSPYSYLWTSEYDMPEWNLGNTFNYAELSWLICPRPFMVERGHDDGVAPDEWVAYEYARTRRHYVKLGLGDRTEIEFFNGPHTINGQGTFAFLKRFLK